MLETKKIRKPEKYEGVHFASIGPETPDKEASCFGDAIASMKANVNALSIENCGS
jgi:hypothetical protein